MNEWEIAALMLVCYAQGIYFGWLRWGRGK